MPEKENEYTTYFFAFSFNVAGLVDSDMSDAQLREKLEADLSAIYGPEGFNIIEVREATEDEITGIAQALSIDENKTLN